MKKVYTFVFSMIMVGLFAIPALAADTEMEIGNLTDSIIETSNNLLENQLPRPLSENDIDYSLAYKIYVDTNVFQIDTNDAETITKALEAGNYIYELPIYVNDSTVIVNISKGLPLDPNVEFTESEKQKILENVGKWGVSAVKFYSGEIVDYKAIIEESVNEVPNETLLVGGLPNFKYAVALLPNEKGEISTLVPLSEVPNIQKIARAKTSTSTNAYDYNQTKNYVNTLPVSKADEAGGYGFPDEAANAANSYIYLVPIILAVAILGIGGFMVAKKRHYKN